MSGIFEDFEGVPFEFLEMFNFEFLGGVTLGTRELTGDVDVVVILGDECFT